MNIALPEGRTERKARNTYLARFLDAGGCLLPPNLVFSYLPLFSGEFSLQVEERARSDSRSLRLVGGSGRHPGVIEGTQLGSGGVKRKFAITLRLSIEVAVSFS